LFLLLTMLLACDKAVPGEPCEVSGDGFSRKDPCVTTCLDYDITCPDGSSVTPDVCSGAECSDQDPCPTGWTCAETGSVSWSCVPEDICPSAGSEMQAAPVPEPGMDLR